MKGTEDQKLIQEIHSLLKLGKQTPQSAETIIKRFKDLLPQIDNHFRTRTPRIFDRISDEYYDEFRTPLAQLRLKALRSILANAEENYQEVLEKIIQLFERKVDEQKIKSFEEAPPRFEDDKIELKPPTTRSPEIEDLKNISSEIIQQTKDIFRQFNEEIKFKGKISSGQLDTKTDDIKADPPSNPQEIKEYPEIQQLNQEIEQYQASIWKMIEKITGFYSSKDSKFDQWEQIINGNLFNHRNTDLLDPKIPRKIIKAFAELVQAFNEIDEETTAFLNHKISGFNSCGANPESKIRAVLKVLNVFFALMLDRERSRIQIKKKQQIKALYNRFVHNHHPKKAEEEEKQKAQFENFCESIIKGQDVSLINTHNLEISETDLDYLKWYLKYFVKEDFEKEIKQANARLQRIEVLVADLRAYCGDDAIGVDDVTGSWKHHIIPLDLQKKRSRALNIKALAQVFAGGLAIGEGAVAAIGNYSLFSGVDPILAGASVLPTLAGSAGCNYAMVVDDTEGTFHVMEGGLAKLHRNDKDEELSRSRKAALWILSCLPSFISGACYGSFGGLSATATVSLILGFFGISLIPVIGWIFFAVGIFTFATVYSILFIETGGAIRNATWEDFKNYFYKRFYWPSKGTRTDEAIAFFKIICNIFRILVSVVIVAGLLFLTGVKLFATSLITLFAKLAWGGSVADKLAMGLSYINSSIWFYFNFKKGSSLLEMVSYDAPLKLIPYIVEMSFRAVLFIVPAIICLVAHIFTWPFSLSISQKFGAYFEKFLDFMAPHKTWNFFNNNKLLRNLASDRPFGLDEATQKSGPINIIGGVIKSTLALVKLVPSLVEVTLRLAVALVYRITWPVRVVCRKIHNHSYQHSEQYRAIAQKCHLKERYREADLGDIIVPRATAWLGKKIPNLFHWLRSSTPDTKRCGEQPSKVSQSAGQTLALCANKAVNINAAGQGETFARGGSANLPGFIKSTPSVCQQVTAGGPQAICSAAIGQRGCNSVLSSKQYVPLSIVNNRSTVFGQKPSPPPGQRGKFERVRPATLQLF